MNNSEMCSTFIGGNAWVAFAITTIGPGHILDDIPNQDAVHVVIRSSESIGEGIAIAVSDGLGTSPKSDIGAALAVEIACEQLLDHLHKMNVYASEPSNLKSTAYGSVSVAANIVAQWCKEVSGHTGSVRDYACTSLVAGVVDGLLCFGQLGDGLAVAMMPDGSYHSISNARYSYVNVTDSIVDTDAVDKWNWAAFDSSEEMPLLVLLATDGIADDLAPDTIGELLNQIYEELCQKGTIAVKSKLADWLAHWPTPAHSDDKSLAILYRSR